MTTEFFPRFDIEEKKAYHFEPKNRGAVRLRDWLPSQLAISP
jgi:hypothetical protein